MVVMLIGLCGGSLTSPSISATVSALPWKWTITGRGALRLMRRRGGRRGGGGDKV